MCSQTADLAAQRVQDAVDAADKTCTVDADCVLASTSSGCNPTCPGVFVSADGVKTLQAAIDDLDTGLCATFYADCGGFPPGPCPPAGTPICLDGQCIVGGALTCSQTADLAAQRVQDAFDAADKTCVADADCVWALTSSGCNGSCGAFVSVDGEKTLQAAIDGLDAGLCASFDADCGVAYPAVLSLLW